MEQAAESNKDQVTAEKPFENQYTDLFNQFKKDVQAIVNNYKADNSPTYSNQAHAELGKKLIELQKPEQFVDLFSVVYQQLQNTKKDKKSTLTQPLEQLLNKKTYSAFELLKSMKAMHLTMQLMAKRQNRIVEDAKTLEKEKDNEITRLNETFREEKTRLDQTFILKQQELNNTIQDLKLKLDESLNTSRLNVSFMQPFQPSATPSKSAKPLKGTADYDRLEKLNPRLSPLRAEIIEFLVKLTNETLAKLKQLEAASNNNNNSVLVQMQKDTMADLKKEFTNEKKYTFELLKDPSSNKTKDNFEKIVDRDKTIDDKIKAIIDTSSLSDQLSAVAQQDMNASPHAYSGTIYQLYKNAKYLPSDENAQNYFNEEFKKLKPQQTQTAQKK